MTETRTRFTRLAIGKVAAGLEDATRGLMAVTLAAPAAASTNRFVVSTNMINGAYALAHTASADGLARNVTVTATTVAAGADTPGTVLVTGLDLNGQAITETLIPLQGSTVAGLKAFASVSSIVGSGWVIAGGNDTIVFGTGTLIGLPVKIAAAADVVQVNVNDVMVARVVTAGGTGEADPLCTSTVDASSGTYNASNAVVVLIGL